MSLERHSHAKYIVAIVFLCIITVLSVVAFVGRTNRMFEAENALTATQSQLADTKTEVVTTQAKLTTTQAELTQTHTDLTTVQSELTTTQNKLLAASANLTATLKKLTATEADYTAVKAQLATETEQSDTLKEALDALQANYDRTTAGYGYVLKDPTYRELKSFIAADRTDENEYIVDSYVCEDFSADVKVHAMQQKIRCAYVSIRFIGDKAHAIVAFNTTDKGIVYIEPQSDEEVNLQAGKHYWQQCVIPKPGTYYLAPDYNDTIARFTNIW
jgi:hypothetical protein